MSKEIKKVMVKVKEEESEDVYLSITFPETKDFEKDFQMGVKYAKGFVGDENPKDYDELFEEMQNLWENVNGEVMFIEYMKKRGYNVKYFKFDYEFEW